MRYLALRDTAGGLLKHRSLAEHCVGPTGDKRRMAVSRSKNFGGSRLPTGNAEAGAIHVSHQPDRSRTIVLAKGG